MGRAQNKEKETLSRKRKIELAKRNKGETEQIQKYFPFIVGGLVGLLVIALGVLIFRANMPVEMLEAAQE